jgi:hypothetical protein
MLDALFNNITVFHAFHEEASSVYHLACFTRTQMKELGMALTFHALRR